MRVALHGHGAVFEVREEDRRDVGVVLDQVSLGDPELGPEELAEPALDARLQPRGARAVARGPGHRDVLQLSSGVHASEQQPSTAHVAAAHEVRGEEQPLPEPRAKDVHVLRGGDAAQQDELALWPGPAGQTLGVAEERFRVSSARARDVHRREALQALDPDRSMCRPQTVRGGDHEHAVASVGRAGEAQRIGELPAEVESAQEREHFTEGSAPAGAYPAGEIEPGAVVEDEAGALTAAVRRGKEENAIR